MTRLKRKIEKLFESFAYLVCRHRFKTLILMLLLIGYFISHIPDLTIDTSFEGMLHENDPRRIQYNDFRDQFGQDRVVILAVEAPEIFEPSTLKKLKELHHDLEKEIPYLDEVNSLVNARNTRGEGDTRIGEDLLKDWPENQIDPTALKRSVLANPLYLHDYISEDGRVAAFIIKPVAAIAIMGVGDVLDDFEDEVQAVKQTQAPKSAKRHYLSKRENKEVVDAVYAIIDRYEAPDFRIALAGGPVTEEVYDSHTKRNMKIFTKAMALVVIVSLFLLFRRISGAVFPLIIVYSALLSTLGIMAMTDVSISVFSVVLPSFLMAVGIADSVHILAIFFRRLQHGYQKVDAIAYALMHSGIAVVMTSLTTAAGLLSFSMSELSSIGHLGIFASVGVMLALLYTVILLPAFLAIFPIKPKKRKITRNKPLVMDRVLLGVADFASGNVNKIIVVSAILFVVSIGFMFQLKFSHNHKNIFPEEMDVRQDEDFLDDKLNGIVSVEIVVDTKKENGLHEPEVLKTLEKASHDVLQIKDGELFVGKVRSMNDILKETNQALHANNPKFYSIPDDRDLIGQELMLFENSGSDDLERIVDSQFSKTRVSIKIPYVEVLLTEKATDEIFSRFRNAFQGLADITVTGMAPMMGKTVSAAIRSMTKSYLVAFFVITFLMIILVGDIRLGLASMIPNLLPIFFVMGFMGAFHVWIDLNALMIGSIAIGLVVDDTMHFMYNFRRYYEMTGDSRKAVRETLLTTGRAMLITSLVLAANFFTLLFASFTSTHKFGFYTGFVILIALVADFVLAPALMILLMPYLKLKKVASPEQVSGVVVQES